MPNTLKEHGDIVWFHKQAPAKGYLIGVRWRITDITTDRGRGFENYSRLRRPFNKDAQSESTAIGGSHPHEEFVRQLLLNLNALSAVHARIEHSCGVSVTVRRWKERSLVIDARSLELEHDDEVGIADENAEEWTSDRLADELLKLDVEKDWPRLRELILTAEDFDFTLDKSALLAPRLLGLAVQYRDSNDSQDAPAVWSAIRTGASMLRPNEASCLLALLKPGHPIETSLVALKMLGRIFEAQPPERLDQHTDLASKVREIAESLLNRYAIASSQSAAMAQLAVYALAAMASNETLHIVRAVRRIGVSWFTQQTARKLVELRSYWGRQSVPVAPKVLELLESTTRELRTT